ncbi:MAG: trypsin-like peptidase domain-containing protein [Planctomycetota bacterium]
MNSDPLHQVKQACGLLTVNREIRSVAYLIGTDVVATACAAVDSIGEQAEVTFDSIEVSATVIARDEKSQTAILRLSQAIDDVLPIPHRLISSVGDDVSVIGYFTDPAVTPVALRGRIEDPYSRDHLSRPSLLLSFAQPVSLQRGMAGAPIVSGGAVIGHLHTSLQADEASSTTLVVGTPFQAVLDSLPEDSKGRLGPAMRRASESKPTDPRIVILAALDEELRYLFGLDCDWSKPTLHRDGTTYRTGSIDQKHEVVAVAVGAMGLTAMAIATAKVLKEWEPDIVALIGVCAGMKEQGVGLGDIIVGSHAFHYQIGKYYAGEIARDLKNENVDDQLIPIVEHFRNQPGFLSGIRDSAPQGMGVPAKALELHIGPIGSADLVVADSQKAMEASASDRKLVAIDMESYAFLRAAKLANVRWAIIAKSVVDFADANKNDEIREYAKYTSTQFVHRFIASFSDQFGAVCSTGRTQ